MCSSGSDLGCPHMQGGGPGVQKVWQFDLPALLLFFFCLSLLRTAPASDSHNQNTPLIVLLTPFSSSHAMLNLRERHASKKQSQQADPHSIRHCCLFFVKRCPLTSTASALTIIYITPKFLFLSTSCFKLQQNGEADHKGIDLRGHLLQKALWPQGAKVLLLISDGIDPSSSWNFSARWAMLSIKRFPIATVSHLFCFCKGKVQRRVLIHNSLDVWSKKAHADFPSRDLGWVITACTFRRSGFYLWATHCRSDRVKNRYFFLL